MGGLNLEGLIRGGPYFRNFTVSFLDNISYFCLVPKRFLGIFRRQSKKDPGKGAAEKPKENLSTLSSAESLFVSQGGSGEGKMRARGTTGSSPALIAISEFTQQVGWKKKTFDKSDKSDRAITGVFCRDIH